MAVLFSATVPVAAAQAVGSTPLTWLAMGDSFSAGEGIPGTTTERDSQGKDCRRATGWQDRARTKTSNAKAWAVVAAQAVDQVTQVRGVDFVACTGAIADDWRQQYDEAVATTGRSTWDVVTFSFGGNNIKFAQTLSNCLDLTAWGSYFGASYGCDETLDTLRDRIDMLAGKAPLVDSSYNGKVALPALYDQIAQTAVAAGGHVYVAGYPSLLENPSYWERWRGACQGLGADDVRLLRSAGELLNTAIRDAVAKADERWRDRDVHFTYLDFAHVYEPSETRDARHGLCTPDQWLNGVTLGLTSGDLRKDRSFHPTQEGHTASGMYTARTVLEGLGGLDPRDPTNRLDVPWLYVTTNAVDAVGPSGEQRSYTGAELSPQNATSFWVGCEGRPAVTTFTAPFGTTTLRGTLLLDQDTLPAGLTVDVRLAGGGGPAVTARLKKGSSVPLTMNVVPGSSVTLSAQVASGTCGAATTGYGIVSDGHFR